MTSRRPGYKAESAFGTFASRELAKTLGNKVTHNIMLQLYITSESANYCKFIYIISSPTSLKALRKLDMSPHVMELNHKL